MVFKGVAQNTTLKAQIKTIVNSLSRVMAVLIGISVLLALVVLFNLTIYQCGRTYP